MVPFDNLLAFTVAAMILIVIPGPSVLFAVGRALTLGKAGGLYTVLGNTLGAIPAIVLVSLGLGIAIVRIPVLFTVLKVAGSAYIVYLGIQAFRHRKDGGPSEKNGVGLSNWQLVRQGFIVGATNPKTIAFFMAVLPQFIEPSLGNVGWQLAQLGILFMVLGGLSDSVWALSAGAARDWFAREPHRLERVRAIGAVLLIGLGIALLLLPE